MWGVCVSVCVTCGERVCDVVCELRPVGFRVSLVVGPVVLIEVCVLARVFRFVGGRLKPRALSAVLLYVEVWGGWGGDSLSVYSIVRGCFLLPYAEAPLRGGKKIYSSRHS